MASRTLRMIYREIPASSPCKAGCSACCGPVPWSAEELAAVVDDIPLDHRWIDVMGTKGLMDGQTGMCPFVAPGGGCKVYDRRPFMCRVFAASADPWLACPQGCRAARPLTPSKTAELTDRYRVSDAKTGHS